MDNVSGTFTLSFENPFWIGVFEIECGKNYEVARVVFGPWTYRCSALIVPPSS